MEQSMISKLNEYIYNLYTMIMEREKEDSYISIIELYY